MWLSTPSPPVYFSVKSEYLSVCVYAWQLLVIWVHIVLRNDPLCLAYNACDSEHRKVCVLVFCSWYVFCFIFVFYWSIVDLQCWISFRYTAKWSLHIFFSKFFSFIGYHKIFSIVSLVIYSHVYIFMMFYEIFRIYILGTMRSQNLPSCEKKLKCPLNLSFSFYG